MSITLGGTTSDPHLVVALDTVDKLPALEVLLLEGVPAQYFIAESNTPWELLKNIRYLNFGPDERFNHNIVAVLTHPNCPAELLQELSDSESLTEMKALTLAPNITLELREELQSRLNLKLATKQKSNNQLPDSEVVSKFLSDYLLFSAGTSIELKMKILASGHPFQIFNGNFIPHNFEFTEDWFTRVQDLEVLNRILWPGLKSIGVRFFYWSSSYTGDCVYIDYGKFDFYRGKDQIADRGATPEISVAHGDSPIEQWFKQLSSNAPEYVLHNLRTHEEGFFDWVEDWKLAAAISCFAEADNDTHGALGSPYNTETADFKMSENFIEYISEIFIDFFDSGSDFVSDVEFIDKSNGLLSWKSTSDIAQVLIVNKLQETIASKEESDSTSAQHFLECIALHPDTKKETLAHMSTVQNEFMQKALESR